MPPRKGSSPSAAPPGEKHERTPPQNIAAEAAVIGAALQDGEALGKAAEIVGAADFYMERHHLIFAALLALRTRGEAVDLLTTAEELRRRGQLEAVGGSVVLTGFLEATPSPGNVVHHARIVRECAGRRRLVEACLLAAEKATNGTGPETPLEQVVVNLEVALLAVQGENRSPEDGTVGVDSFLTKPPDLGWDVEGVRVQGDHGWTGGAPKSMKGLLSLEEARACATGTPFLGHFRTRRAKVLYISEEDRAERLHRRVHAMLQDRPPEEVPGPEDLRFLVKAGVRLDMTEGLAVLKNHLERWRPAIVFLEHFDKLHRKTTRYEEEARPVLDVLDDLHASFGCSFRIQKHHRKEGAGQSKRKGEMLAGSIALFGWGESSVYLTLLRKGQALVEVEAKDGDTAGVFLVEYRDGRIVYAGEAKNEKAEQKKAEVLEFLDKHPGATTGEIAKALEVSERSVSRRLGPLRKLGAVVGQQSSVRAEKRWWHKPSPDQGAMV